MNSSSAILTCIILSSLGLTGCSEYGGGAALVPEVVVLPAELSGEVEVTSSESGSAGDSKTGTASGGGTGTFKGRVVLTGTGPSLPLPLLIAKGAAVKDADMCSIKDVPDETLLVSADKGVKNVFVYLARAPKGVKLPPLPTEPIIFDQQYCKFDPHCLVVATGQPIKVWNSDTKPHNTHTYPVRNDPPVNQVVSAGDREGKLQIIYDKAEPVPLSVKCDYHTWMIAYQLPVDHPFAAVTDENGEFEIPNLPAGEHSFVVWHEAAGFVDRKLKVTVAAGESKPQTIAYPAEKISLK